MTVTTLSRTGEVVAVVTGGILTNLVVSSRGLASAMTPTRLSVEPVASVPATSRPKGARGRRRGAADGASVIALVVGVVLGVLRL